MSDKEKYSGKVWFVRGVPAELRAEVATAAERAGMKVGAWVERVLRAALERPEGQGAPPDQGAAGDLAALVAAISATVDAQAEAIHVLFEHRRQDFPAIVERVERLEAHLPPAIPGRSSGDGDKAQAEAAIPGRLGSALDAVEPEPSAKMPPETEALPGPSGRAGKGNRPIPAEHLEEADRLQAGGMSFKQIIGAKGWTYNRSGLAKAVQRWREERAKAVPDLGT